MAINKNSTLATLVLLTAAGSTPAATIALDPATADGIGIGEKVTFSIRGLDFNGGTTPGSAAGGGVDVSWDPGVLRIIDLDDVVLTYPDTSFGANKGVLDNVVGTLSGLGVGGTALTATFDIASLTFTAVGAGTSVINLGPISGVANPWFDGDGSLANPVFIDGSATVVPLPAAVWLFTGALLGMGGLGIKRRQAS